MVTNWWWLLAAAVAVVGVLAVIAGRLLWQLRVQQRAQQQRVNETALQAQDGIRVLAGSYLAGQVESSEASLRIAVLLDQPGVANEVKQRGQPFVGLAGELAHIPTHQAWKDLPADQRRAFRAQMETLESRYQSALKGAAEELLAVLGQG